MCGTTALTCGWLTRHWTEIRWYSGSAGSRRASAEGGGACGKLLQSSWGGAAPSKTAIQKRAQKATINYAIKLKTHKHTQQNAPHTHTQRAHKNTDAHSRSNVFTFPTPCPGSVNDVAKKCRTWFGAHSEVTRSSISVAPLKNAFTTLCSGCGHCEVMMVVDAWVGAKDHLT